MATYTFETITAAQALAITATDNVIVQSGTATGVIVAYNAATATTPDTVTVTIGSRSVTFNTFIQNIAQQGNVVMPDGTLLYIGSSGPDDNSGLAPWGTANASNDAAFGGVGADLLVGRGGNDLLQGNQGADSLNGGSGNDTVYGGQDGDTIDLGAGSNFGQGNKGTDTITGSATGADTILGGQDDDLIGATGFDTAGAAVLAGNGGADFLNGNLGNDTVIGGTGADQIFGEDGNDSLVGGGGADVINGGAGQDQIRILANSTVTATAWGGNDADTITGGSVVSGDQLNGGQGNDSIVGANQGTAGGDTLSGGQDNDTIYGGGGLDLLNGDLGNDSIVAASGFDTAGAPIASTNGARIFGGDGNDDLVGNAGNDSFNGGADQDSVTAGAGNDTALGGDGGDILRGGAGNDSLDGGAQNDTLHGNADADTMAGGAGADFFYFVGVNQTAAGSLDQIVDWDGSQDRLWFVDSAGGAFDTGGTVTYGSESSAADYASALASANAQLGTVNAGGATIDVVAVQIGGDVVVFADNEHDGNVDSAVVLVGRTLNDISGQNFN